MSAPDHLLEAGAADLAGADMAEARGHLARAAGELLAGGADSAATRLLDRASARLASARHHLAGPDRRSGQDHLIEASRRVRAHIGDHPAIAGELAEADAAIGRALKSRPPTLPAGPWTIRDEDVAAAREAMGIQDEEAVRAGLYVLAERMEARRPADEGVVSEADLDRALAGHPDAVTLVADAIAAVSEAAYEPWTAEAAVAALVSRGWRPPGESPTAVAEEIDRVRGDLCLYMDDAMRALAARIAPAQIAPGTAGPRKDEPTTPATALCAAAALLSHTGEIYSARAGYQGDVDIHIHGGLGELAESGGHLDQPRALKVDHVDGRPSLHNRPTWHVRLSGGHPGTAGVELTVIVDTEPADADLVPLRALCAPVPGGA